MLTDDQAFLAQILRTNRPPTIPGTNVIPDDAARNRWYGEVKDALNDCQIVADADIKQFCDIAGVPS